MGIKTGVYPCYENQFQAGANSETLNDIAEEAGYYLHSAHNAYNDVWAEVSVFTYLKKIEEQKGEEICSL